MNNVWIAVVSEIWIHRNNCLFKGGVVDHTEVFTLWYRLRFGSGSHQRYRQLISYSLIGV